MPRKKLTPPTETAELPVPEAAAPKPTRNRKAPSSDAVPTPVAAVKPPRPSRAKKAAEPEKPVQDPAPAEAITKPKRPSRAKTVPVEVAPEPEPAPEVPPTAEPKAEEKKPATARKSPPRRIGAKAATSITEPTTSVVVEAAASDSPSDEPLPVPTWRPISAKPAKTEAVTESGDDDAESDGDDASSTGDEGGKKRRRRRRRGGRRDNEEAEATEETPATPAEPTAAPVPAVFLSDPDSDEPLPQVTLRPRKNRSQPTTVVVEKAPEAAPAPTPTPTPIMATPVRPEIRAPKRPPLDVPEDAPQVILRNGVPVLVRNQRAYPPIFFFGSPADERRAQTVLEELQMAAESGVHVHSFLVNFDVDRDSVENAVSVAAFILKKAVEVDPQAQVIFRLAFLAPRNWIDRYPAAKFRDAHGELSEPSVCDDDYWGVAASCLDLFVRKLRLLELKDNILGIHLERGEWFLAHDAGYDTSTAARNKFRDWARTRYNNDEVTLRASWFDGSVRFDNILVPEYHPEGTEGERFVRASRKGRKYVDYHLFLSDATVSRISDLAYTVKKSSDGYFLVGTSYGYTFEWSHPASGHLSLGKILRAPEIDFLAGPPSYRDREPGGTAPFPGPIDSIALNGKLYLSEEDFKTSLSQGHEPDDFNPPLKTPQALDSVHWRGIGAALAHGSGVQWMDLWGNGWLRSNSIWDRAEKVLEILTDRIGQPLGDPDVAVFIDERALAYLIDENAFAMLVQNVRESILRAGVSAAFYLLSDLQHREKFPDSKLYLFLNAWDIRPELRAAIKSRLQRDEKVLFWLYSAGLFDAGRDSLERAREVTGIALKPQPYYSKAGTTIVQRRHPLAEAFPERSLSGGTKLEPSYFAIPEDALVLGEYSQTGLPSFVVKEFRDGKPSQWWTSVFLGEPVVNPALIRALAQMAGAHVVNHQNDVTHYRAPFLTVHCSGTGPRALTLPNKWSAFNLLSRQWAAVDSTNLRFHAMDGSTHVFLVGAKEELETILNRDPRELLKIAELPPREANEYQDISNFDVPVMKLDEWMESGDGDEVADDWFLRAPTPVDEPETATAEERPGRRRRRRRGGRDVRGEESGDARVETVTSPDEDFGMSVMFRKRE